MNLPAEFPLVFAALFSVFNGALWIAIAAIVMMLFYQWLIALFGLRVRPYSQPSRAMKFGVVIPAHNESGGIHLLLDSLARVDYPREQLCIVIVADHCSDNTAELIRACGIHCIERNDGPPGKSHSLAVGIQWLQQQVAAPFDAVAFFDADNVIDPSFFSEAAGAFDVGCNVVQGKPWIQNPDATMFARVNAISAAVENRYREMARSQAGLSCHLRGHGMVFRWPMLAQVDWDAGTMVEDQAMSLRLALQNHRVVWLESAVVASVLPDTMEAAAAQRIRWAGGKSALVETAVSALRKKWLQDSDWNAFDMMIDFILPSYAVQLAFCGLIWLLTIPFGSTLQLATATAALGGYVLYFISGSLLGGISPRLLLSAFAAPVFILWRTWIYVLGRRGVKRWR